MNRKRIFEPELGKKSSNYTTIMVNATKVDEDCIYYDCAWCNETHKHGKGYNTYPKDRSIIEDRLSHCLGTNRIVVDPSIIYGKKNNKLLYNLV